MIKSVYVYYDKEVKAFGLPQFQDLTPAQFGEGLTRGILKGFELEKLNLFAGQELYFIGTYDDNVAEFSPIEKQKILDCDPLIQERVKRENEKKAGENNA